jgi:uncharacterized membrane protein
MILLILGLLLWWATHLEKILAPGQRAAAVARIGEGPWKGLIALLTLLAIVLMVIGYRNAAYVPIWTPPAWLWHVNNLLMVLAVLVFIAGSFASPVRRRIRHPQLTGVKIWTVAHLLVNGHLAAVVLFGGLLAWAVVAVIGTNRRDGPRGTLPEATTAGLVAHIGVTIVVFAVVGWLHGYVGAWPFPG